MQALRQSRPFRGLHWSCWKRFLTHSCTGNEYLELSSDVKHRIESHWRGQISGGQFDATQPADKFYVLSMFPYPSGNLHMGHVRVYTIGDAVARFQRMCGKNVFQPIGWDSFGLPAENAANQRGVEPAAWTQQNIAQMKQQLERLGCSFDWTHELSTCSPQYYRWTQQLFLMLHKHGLAYQNEALVNWDPVDQTVLADEQVDANGCSWRSGAKVEKKLLKQWFIRTTAYAKQLLDGLDDPTLRDWRDIINLQRHWIGECNGYAFTLLTSASNLLRVWTANPEHLKDPNAFLVLRSKHYLSKLSTAAGGGLSVENPFAGTTIPVVFSDEAAFPPDCDVYLAAPSFRSEDRELWDSFGLAISASATEKTRLNPGSGELLRKEVLQAATRLNAGGYRVSSKLQDWLISRQRYWGTPIPIVHCPKCGAVPVPEEQLPVTLPKRESQDSLLCECPKCGGAQAKRETDTMDTFVDSSWYYLRFLDAHNSERIFDPSLASQFMPVDLYIGGKEHAVLHLYYARFMNHFLNKCGLSPTSEPFSRLLVQGMVMGRSFRVKGSGRYVREDEVEVVNAKKNQALLKETQEPVVMTWEKMSKSKQNGVEPGDMFDEYGTDTTRLIILADVAPTSHRNWSSATFPGILNWQKRLWLTLQEFQAAREEAPSDVDVNSEEFLAEDAKLFDARNFYVKGATFNYRHAHQLSVAISKMQGLTNSIRRTPKHIQRHGRQFERALAAQIIMLAPMAPHFASELWSKFVAVKGRLNEASPELQWAEDVLSQRWPDIDAAYNLELSIKVNGFENCVIKVQRTLLDKVTHSDALDIAFNTESVTSYLIDKKIRTTNFVLYPGIEAILNIYVDKVQKKEKPASRGAADKVLADP